MILLIIEAYVDGLPIFKFLGDNLLINDASEYLLGGLSYCCLNNILLMLTLSPLLHLISFLDILLILNPLNIVIILVI